MTQPPSGPAPGDRPQDTPEDPKDQPEAAAPEPEEPLWQPPGSTPPPVAEPPRVAEPPPHVSLGKDEPPQETPPVPPAPDEGPPARVQFPTGEQQQPAYEPPPPPPAPAPGDYGTPPPVQTPYGQQPYAREPYGQEPGYGAPYGQEPAGYGAPSPYGQAGYGGYGGYGGQQPPGRTNTLAIVSLVASLIWFCGAGSLVGVITGHLGLKQIKGSGGRQEGKGLAIAGLVIGYLGLAALLFWILVFSAGFFEAVNDPSYEP